MKKFKRISALAAAVIAAASMTSSFSADNMIIEIIPEAASAQINVYPDKERTPISQYIYGITDNADNNGLHPEVLKQKSIAVTTYNWETNFSNPGISGMNTNDVSLVSSYPSSRWNTPALYSDLLNVRARQAGIPMKLVTLQMMGYVAADSLGIVAEDSSDKRWLRTSFRKNDTFLNKPDTNDDIVYIDEYVSYLVNKYGSAYEGGFSGYFLDSEPDMWSRNFSVLGLNDITPEELLRRSSELAYSVKTIDSGALVFGPSLSGLQGCINLNSKDSWNVNAYDGQEYSWFIDYYLNEMRLESEKKGTRLLDVLDIHYYTEAMTPIGTAVLYNNDEYCNAYRMQSVRTLWDPAYTENSVSVLMNKQFTPIIPTLKASIRVNYPGTKLSFSEYDFGGGNNISGAVAQVDALGTFAREGVYLACLSPVSDDISFQKAAFRLFTDYDNNGSGFGDEYVSADNGDDATSSVFAASDKNAPEMLRLIISNKNMVKDKEFLISINSQEYSYELESAYTIDSETADITQMNINKFTHDGDFLSFTSEDTGVYMLVLRGSENETQVTEGSEGIWTTGPSDEISDTQTEQTDESISEATEASFVTEITEITSAENIVSESSSDTQPSDVTSVNEEVSSETLVQSETSFTEENSASDTKVTSHEPGAEKGSVAMPVKIIVSILAVTVALGVLYILVFDRK